MATRISQAVFQTKVEGTARKDDADLSCGWYFAPRLFVIGPEMKSSAATFLRFFALGGFFLNMVACQSSDPVQSGPTAPTAPDPAAPAAILGTLETDALAAGEAIFVQRCVVCHGPDGKLGNNGAHDLTKSNLNTNGRVYIVTNGLGKMPAFKDQLTEQEIEQVAAYSLTLH
ncbi:c-type cytochrome [Hymenobacter sp. HD11105]|jgi:cytochrome c6